MNVNDLSQEQKSLIEQWVNEGQDFNALQKSINNQFGLKLTFMDTRFLILDMGLQIQTKEEDPSETREPALTTTKGTGQLELSISEITRPGMAVSGDVIFPSGAFGIWFIDSQYRIGIDPDASSPEPTEKDMNSFQTEIKGFLRNHMGGI